MDVIFYLVISLLVATIFCYVIFLVKNGMIKKEIDYQISTLRTVGSQRQKEHETEVLKYKSKINDFSKILNNHEFASNVFAFMHGQTMENVWFSQFSFDEKSRGVQLEGESDSIDSFSRQVENLENNEHVKSMGSINSSQAQSSRIHFNISLVFDPKIFDYLSDISLTSAVSPSGAAVIQGALPNLTANNPAEQQSASEKSSQKLITSFHLRLTPDVAGQIDQSKYTISINVPYGTDIKNLTPAIVISPKATVTPVSLSPQNFSNLVSYTVVAEDGSSQVYSVKVTVLPATGNQKSNQIWVIGLVIILLVIIIIAVVIIFLRRRIGKQ